MRKAIAAIAVTLAASAIAQPFERVEVVQVDSASASELYRRAERWFVDNFHDVQEVIQLRDTVNRTLIGTGSGKALFYTSSGMAAVSNDVWYTYRVEVGTKEGRYRVRVYDVALTQGIPVTPDSCCYGTCDYPSAGKKLAANLRVAHLRTCASIHADLTGIFSGLQTAMRKRQDDW